MVRKKAKRVRRTTKAKGARRAKVTSRFRRRRGRPPASAPVHLTRVAELTQAQPITLPTYPKALGSSKAARRIAPGKRSRAAGARVKTMATEIGRLLKSKRRSLTAPAAAEILRILRSL